MGFSPSASSCAAATGFLLKRPIFGNIVRGVDDQPIRAVSIRHANRHLIADGLLLPMAFKACAGRKAGTRFP
jgi:hypothetical protein